MNTEILERAVQLANKVGYVFVATAYANKWPHVAAAGRLALTPDSRVVVTEWFCPGTMANLQVNPRLSLVVWDSVIDVGYQLTGELKEIKDLGMLNGYASQVEAKIIVPQVERQLSVHINKVIEFKRAPHSDVEE